MLFQDKSTSQSISSNIFEVAPANHADFPLYQLVSSVGLIIGCAGIIYFPCSTFTRSIGLATAKRFWRTPMQAALVPWLTVGSKARLKMDWPHWSRILTSGIRAWSLKGGLGDSAEAFGPRAQVPPVAGRRLHASICILVDATSH